jgi:hypothetical protein
MRVRAWVVTALVMGVALSPLLSERDSFPHSSYPMFASARGEEAFLSVAYALDADGGLLRLSPRTIAGSVEVVHAAETIGRSMRMGDEDRLCAEIATRVAARGPSDAVTVVVARERHDLVASVAGDPTPLETDERARCAVPGVDGRDEELDRHDDGGVDP